MLQRRNTLILFHIILVSGIQYTTSRDDSEINEIIREFFHSPIVFTQKQNELQISTGLALSKPYDNRDTFIPIELKYGIAFTKNFRKMTTILECC